MTVREAIAWLETQDQDAIMMCIKHERRGSYYEQGGTCQQIEFEPSLSHYTDFRGNEWVKPSDDYHDKRYLLIGELD